MSTKSSKLNTHVVNIDVILFHANKKRSIDNQYTRESFMSELGKGKQIAVQWKKKSPEIVSLLVKMKEMAGVSSIDELITPIND